MKRYIDKSALVAEIERRKQDAINNCGGFKSGREHECDSCIVAQYEEMLEILDTIEVKEVNLEKEFYDFLDTLTGKDDGHLSDDELFRIAEYFFALGIEAKDGDLELKIDNNKPKITVGTKIRSKTNPDLILSIISNDCHEDEFECSNGSVLSLKQIEKHYDIYIEEK